MLITPEVSAKIKESTGILLMPGLSILGSGVIASPSMIYGGRGILHNVSLGGYSYLVPPFEATNLSIGNYTSIARGLIIALGHPTNLLTASPVAWRPWMEGCEFPGKTSYEYLSTQIGSDVWIGANVIIKAGVKIGDGCFIGAGSVVTKDIPPFSVAAGNPCRIIRPRFAEDIVERIMRLRWFDYDWRDQMIDWRDPVASLDSIEAALEAGFSRRFNFFRYAADDERITLQRILD